jgi:hypothetical protein
MIGYPVDLILLAFCLGWMIRSGLKHDDDEKTTLARGDRRGESVGFGTAGKDAGHD